MNGLDYKPEYRRRLPHLQPPSATFFVTFRLAGSIPQIVIKRWQEERDELKRKLQRIRDEEEAQQLNVQFNRTRFFEMEQILDSANTGENWLKDARLAENVCRFLKNKDGQQYRLDAYCVMSNHVHVLLMPLPQDKAKKTYYPLQKILHSIKRLSALECNQLLQQTGTFWEDESFDHFTRDHDEWVRVLHYILNNPVKAKIVQNWRDYRFNYCSEMAIKYVTI